MFTSFLTVEFISMVASGIVGFIFRSLAERRKAEQDRFNRMLDAMKQSDSSMNQAVQRVPVDVGKVVRRTIVLTILFGTIVAPFLLPFFNIPVVVENQETSESIFWGLFGSSNTTVYHQIYGFLFTQENRQILLTIVGFYFGNAAAANKT